jgi:hypothetical protein
MEMKKSMRKITAYGRNNRIPMSLSNYMPGCRKGIKVARQEFIDTISRQPMDAKAICKALNGHRWTADKFQPFKESEDVIQLIATDPWGNEDIIRIAEEN